jgi:hypothetical protein
MLLLRGHAHAVAVSSRRWLLLLLLLLGGKSVIETDRELIKWIHCPFY